MNATRFIALHCGDDAQALLANHPNAFLLLTQIAMRAKWKDCPISRMSAGQAYIGDFQKAGIHSEMAYRHAKKVLIDCKIATFKGTNKGTVATLMDSRIFSITAESGTDKATPQQRTRNGQGTTNHTDTQSTLTPFALNGDHSVSPLAITWNPESGFDGISETDRREWMEAFPAVNIDQQLAHASRWLKDNPTKRKKQIGRFITGWFSRCQERGGDIPAQSASRTFSKKPQPQKADEFKL